jgi:hypothetical protein
MLISTVLRWAKRGLGSTNVAFSIGELESVGLYSYTLAVHVFNMFHSEGIAEVLELTKDVCLLITFTSPKLDFANNVSHYETDL